MPKLLPVNEEWRRDIERVVERVGGLPERTLLFSVMCIRDWDWRHEVWAWEELTDDDEERMWVHAIVEMGQEGEGMSDGCGARLMW